MIGVKVQGRLGNQLFQFAFAYSLSRKYGTGFYLDQTEQLLYISQYFNVKKDINYYLVNILFDARSLRKYNYGLRRRYYSLLDHLFIRKQLEFAPDATCKSVMQLAGNQTMYTGFFQSELFFLPYAGEIRHFFQLKKKIVDQYHRKYDQVFNERKIITVHIRRDDYKNLGGLNLGADDLTLPLSYYHRLLAKLDANDSLFVFMTDDPDGIKNEFNYLTNTYFSDDILINDLQHLINADICVIANSTFSWWGAWLNQKPHKEIYAPAHFLGHILKQTWPPDIYPPGWKIIDVYE